MVDIINTADNPNHVSFGLTITKDNRVIVAPMPEGKQVVNAGARCPEHDPDFLPAAALRTRRFNEQYPYNAVQGYRSGQNVEVRTYLQPDYARPLPPPARVVTYMLEQAFEYPVLTEHGIKIFQNDDIYLEIAQCNFKKLLFGGIRLFNNYDIYWPFKSDAPDQFTPLRWANSPDVDNRYWIGQSGNQITTMRREADFIPGGVDYFSRTLGVDVVKTFTMDYASGQIDVQINFINPSPTETVVNMRHGESFYSDAWYQIAGSVGTMTFGRGHGSVPASRLIRAAADQSPYTELGVYTLDNEYSVQLTIDGNFDNDPDSTLLGLDTPPSGNYALLNIAWMLGDFAPGQVKTVNYKLIVGTDPAVMYGGLV